MDLLIVEALEPELMAWLSARYELRFAPELAFDRIGFREALEDARAAIVPASVAVDAQTLRVAPDLRAIGRVSAGIENIDLDACARAGVEVVRSQNATAAAEAEFMVGALLALMRRTAPSIGGLPVTRELGSARVGLIGMTPPARVMSQLLGAFGARVVGYDPGLHASDSVWSRWRVESVGLRELFETCDALCVQLGYFSRWRGLLGDRWLPHGKPQQVMVSISHSGLFDESALAAALSGGPMAAAWLDSVEPGMLDEGRPLATAPNLQVTPRLASTTRESRLRSAWVVVQRIDELLSRPRGERAFSSTTSPGALPDRPGDLVSS